MGQVQDEAVGLRVHRALGRHPILASTASQNPRCRSEVVCQDLVCDFRLLRRLKLRPNTRETSRMLIPSTITARRTRRYTSTFYASHALSEAGLGMTGFTAEGAPSAEFFWGCWVK